MKENEVSFRDALRGYNKEDVNAYIEKINQDFMYASAASAKDIHERDEIIASLKDQISKIDAESMKRELEELKNELNKAQVVIMAQTEQIAKSSEVKAELDMKLAEAEGKLKEASGELEELHGDDDVYEKAKKYDEAAAMLGKVMLEAEKNAEAYRKRAIAYVDRLLEEAKGRISEYCASSADRYHEIFSSAQAEMLVSADQFRQKLDDEQKKSAESFSAFKLGLVDELNSQSSDAALSKEAEINERTGECGGSQN